MRTPMDSGTVLITGASSGVGRELARQLARRARTLVLVSRDEARLEPLRNELLENNPTLGVVVERCDLTQPDDVDALLDSLQRHLIRVDVLVNGAGLGDFGLYEQERWSDVQRMLQVNVMAPLMLTHRLVRRMVRRKWGGVLNIYRGEARGVDPGQAVFTATRRFLEGFTESLRLELLGTGVVVTQVASGDLQDTAPGEQSAPWTQVSAAQCAREAIEGFERALPLVRPGWAHRWMARLAALLPRGVKRAAGLSTARRLRHGAEQFETPRSASYVPALLAGACPEG